MHAVLRDLQEEGAIAIRGPERVQVAGRFFPLRKLDGDSLSEVEKRLVQAESDAVLGLDASEAGGASLDAVRRVAREGGTRPLSSRCSFPSPVPLPVSTRDGLGK